jgi:hypothetical protein
MLKLSFFHSVMLGHPKQDQLTCLFTDASDLYWGLAIIQIPEDIVKSMKEQCYQKLAFMSGSFSGSQLHFRVIEKEAYPFQSKVPHPYGAVFSGEERNQVFHCDFM